MFGMRRKSRTERVAETRVSQASSATRSVLLLRLIPNIATSWSSALRMPSNG